MNQFERVARCPIDVFVASNMTYPYPYKLVKPKHASKAVADSCETVILDSGIGDDISNRDVLNLSEELDTDFVVAKDYLHEHDSTTESINEFLDLWETHDTRATPMVPIQPPHDEHYKQLDNEVYHVMLGGMAFDYDSSEIIQAVKKFRDTAGMAPYVHLLGVGANRRVMQFLADNPGIVQSLDCSTPEQCAINGKIFDTRLIQQEYQIRTGDGSTSTRAGLAQHLAYTLCDAITMMHENQTQTLEAWT